MSNTKSKHSSLPPIITSAAFPSVNIVFFFLVETLIALDSVTTTYCKTVFRRPRHVHIPFLSRPVQSRTTMLYNLLSYGLLGSLGTSGTEMHRAHYNQLDLVAKSALLPPPLAAGLSFFGKIHVIGR